MHSKKGTLNFDHGHVILDNSVHLLLNNRVFLSRNYRLIVAPRKFDVLKTNKYASFKNIKFPRRNYQTDRSETS